MACQMSYVQGHVEVSDAAGHFRFSADTRQEAMQELRLG